MKFKLFCKKQKVVKAPPPKPKFEHSYHGYNIAEYAHGDCKVTSTKIEDGIWFHGLPKVVKWIDLEILTAEKMAHLDRKARKKIKEYTEWQIATSS